MFIIPSRRLSGTTVFLSVAAAIGRVSAATLLPRCVASRGTASSCSGTTVGGRNMTDEAPYTLEPMLPHFGVYVRNFSLHGKDPLPQGVVDRIKDDLKKHRVMVFKDQGQIPGARQVQISEQLGEVESTFYKHPRSPHPDIFRVSNDEKEGCTNVGRTGWHIDGTFQAKPFSIQTMHLHSICEGGETWFVPLNEFYEMQSAETKAKWDKMWMVTGRGQHAHPLVYKHPIRGDSTLMFHCGDHFCAGWAVDDDAPNPADRKPKGMIKPSIIQNELTRLLDEAVDKIGVKMNWEVGDFALNDNLGNCHYAAPGTQNSSRSAGLRILHRTTIAGETIPEKADGRKSFLIDF